jgi:hypothetical protein
VQTAALAETARANFSESAVIVALISWRRSLQSVDLETSLLTGQYHDLRDPEAPMNNLETLTSDC